MKIRKFTIISFIMIVILAATTLICIKSDMDSNNKTDDLIVKNNIRYVSTIENKNFIIYPNKQATAIKIRAVRLSSVTPYYERNQGSISKKIVKKWLNQIKDMNANTIIVPYIQSPNFYEAIYEYNLTNNPIYIIHEVEITTDLAKTSYNLYDHQIYNDLINKVKKTIDVVHGRRLLLNNKKSHTGLYLADISNYLIGYIIGTDIAQEMVAITNMNNENINSYQGKYFKVESGTGFECLIAKILEESYNYELNKYKSSKLFSFSSIVETDPFSHYNETNAIKNATTSLNNIQSDYLFASIVVYPDALSYLNLGDIHINRNYYYDYLVKYNNLYKMPIIVSNIGISTSRGKSNITFNSEYDRGGNNEDDQAKEIVELLEDIDKSGISGVGINSFHDDWGQMTAFNMKNIIAKTNNNYWYDAMSSDEAFGLASFQSNLIEIDGNDKDFKKIKSSSKTKDLDVKITSDSAYLYLCLNTSVENDIYIGFDILKSIGSKTYKTNEFNITNDFVLELNGKDKTELFVNNRYDIFTYNNYFYDNILGKQDNAPSKNTKEFNSIYLLNQKKLLIQSNIMYIDGIYYNTGKLVFGRTKDNSLADFYQKGDTIEIRIPWILINVNNPIDKTVQGDFYENGIYSSINVSNIKIQVKSNTLDSGIIKYKIPNYKNIKYKEHLKKSYYKIKKYWEVW